MPQRGSRTGKTPERGYAPRTFSIKNKLDRALGYLKVGGDGDKSELVNEALELYLTDPVLIAIPLIGNVRGGAPITAEENIEERIPLPERITRGAEYALRVYGNSMAPWIDVGDVVFVNPRRGALHGDVVIAYVDEDHGEREAVIKRYNREGRIPVLRSDNPDYHDVILPDRFEIAGVVVGLYREYGR